MSHQDEPLTQPLFQVAFQKALKKAAMQGLHNGGEARATPESIERIKSQMLKEIERWEPLMDLETPKPLFKVWRDPDDQNKFHVAIPRSLHPDGEDTAG